MSIYIRNVDLLRRRMRNLLLNSISLLYVMTIYASITNRCRDKIIFFFLHFFFSTSQDPKSSGGHLQRYNGDTMKSTHDPGDTYLARC